MEFSKLKSNQGNYIDDIALITPKVFKDDRGFFYESWNEINFQKIAKNIQFVQDNHSKSSKGVLRGLHYQLYPFAQGKLVRCTSGNIYDVAIDLRKNSKTYKEFTEIELNDKNNFILWIPEGFAHGFLSLSNFSEVQYKTTKGWMKDYEISLLWNDPDLNINWPINRLEGLKPILSTKDSNAMNLKKIESQKYYF